VTSGNVAVTKGVAAEPVPSPFARKAKTYARKAQGWLLAPLAFTGLIALWHLSSHVFGVPGYILPPPEEVGSALLRGLMASPTDPSGFWYHLYFTGAEALIGFVVGSAFGIVAGICVARWRTVEVIVYPYIVALQSMPKVAIAPLIIIWFGFGMSGKVMVTSIITFFPLLVNTMIGYRAVDRDRIDFARSCNASEFQILYKIILPSALPYIFAGLNVASVLALLGALVGEFVGAQAGLGMLLMQYNQSMQMASAFALLIVLAAVGFLANGAIRMVEDRVCGWARRGTDHVTEG
jgi:NitT/TauT family transport system permease protein